MDILEQQSKLTLDDTLKKLFKKLKFKRFPIDLKGSASLQSQRYYSDYDLLSNITRDYDSKVAYKEFSKIIKRVLDFPDVYFIELKLETIGGEKIKWFPNDRFDYTKFSKYWDNVNYVKLDLIMRSENRFIEVSVIYSFSNTKLTPEEYIGKLETDIEDLKKENKYYKILKRLFSIYKIKKDKKKLLQLNSVFNSPLGALYQKISNLEAIKLLLENYKDETTKKKVEVNLKDIKESPDISEVMKKLKMYNKELNKKAYEIYSTLK